MGAPARPAERGVTLLELLVALAIVALIAASIAAPFARTIDTRDRTELAIERTNAARLMLTRIAEELEGAILLTGPRYRFVTADQALDRPASELAFATTAARRITQGPQDPVELVHYHVEPAPGASRHARLVKDQEPSLQVDDFPPASFVVLENVTQFRVCVVAAVGVDCAFNWTSGNGTAAGQLPRAVAVELGVEDGTPDPPTYRVVVTLPLAASK